MISSAFLLSVLPFFLLVSACGSNGPIESYQNPTPSPNEGQAFDVNGTFAVRLVLSQYVESPLAVADGGFEQQTLITYSLARTAPGEDSGTLRYQELDCYSERSDVSGSSSTLTQGYYDNQPNRQYIASISAPEIGAEFSLPRNAEVTGAVLDHPESDPLPDDPEDERVVDFDEDGEPGYTVDVEGIMDGSMGMVDRFTYSVTGQLAGKDDISGLVSAKIEPSTLWVSNKLFPTDTETYMDEVAEHNFVEMHRVSDTFTCSDVVAQRTQLFEGH